MTCSFSIVCEELASIVIFGGCDPLQRVFSIGVWANSVMYNFIRCFPGYKVVRNEFMNVGFLSSACSTFNASQVYSSVWPAGDPWFEIIIFPRFQKSSHSPHRTYFVVMCTCRLGDAFPCCAGAARAAAFVFPWASTLVLLPVRAW